MRQRWSTRWAGLQGRSHASIYTDLYVMCSRHGSQCRSIMWSNRRSMPKITRAAGFNTDCLYSCCMRDQGKRCKNSIFVFKPTMNRLWTDYEPTMNRLWTDYEPTMNRLWTDIWTGRSWDSRNTETDNRQICWVLKYISSLWIIPRPF